MSDQVEKILKGAASNVACESKEEVSRETLESIRKQLVGETNHSDESFIYGLYQSIVRDKGEDSNGKTHVRK